VPVPCGACGEPVVKRRRRHCDACIPGMKAAQADKAVVAARKALAAQAAAGTDPRRDLLKGTCGLATQARMSPSILRA
jgi:hypothetical protein